MSDEQQDDQTPTAPQDDEAWRRKKPWLRTGRERLLALRAERERHKFPVRERETDTNAARDDEYSPF